MVDGYHLDHFLGTTGKNETYRARQLASGQWCLITFFRTDDKNGQEFLLEAKRAASLFSPNVVDVYDAGSLDTDEFFVVTEEPSGQTLRELLNSVGVPQLLTSIHIIRQVAEGLHTLHLSGLTHRAVRPENIVVTADSEQHMLIRVQNIDFAGAVERSIIGNKFLIDSALGTLKYYAPEQCSGEETTVQTDIYSLGIVFYEMLAGVPPFDASKAAGLIAMHKNQPPPDVRISDFELRMLVTHTLTESLQKLPKRRQSSANALARQLRHIEQLATHTSTPPPAGQSYATPEPPVLPTMQARSVSNAPAAAAVVPARAPSVESRPIKIESTPVFQPPAVKVEAPPVTTEVEIPTEIEPEVVDHAVEAETLEAGRAEPAPQPRIEEPDEERTSASVENIEFGVARRSRLKNLKKKLRQMTVVPTPELNEKEAVPAAEAPEIDPVDIEPEPVVPALESPKTDEISIPVTFGIPAIGEWKQQQTDAFSGPEQPSEIAEEESSSDFAWESVLRTEERSEPEDIPNVLPESEEVLPEFIDEEPKAIVQPSVGTVEEPEHEIVDVPDMTENAPLIEAPDKPAPAPDVIEVEGPVMKAPETAEVICRDIVVPTPKSNDIIPIVHQASSTKKIVWNQPEDDIPSEADVLEVLMQEGPPPLVVPQIAIPTPKAIDIVPVAQQAPLTKIVWNQPEDDIPSEADVIEVLTENGFMPAIETRFKADLNESVPVNDVVLPTIEISQWDEPLATAAVAVPATEPIEVRAIAVEPVVIAEASGKETPLVTEKNPLRAAPRKTNARKTKSKAKKIEKLVLPKFEADEITVVTTRKVPTRIELAEDDIPSEADVLHVLSRDRAMEPIALDPPTDFSVRDSYTLDMDYAPTRFSIPIPSAIKRNAPSVRIADGAGPLFTTFYDDAMPRYSINYRSIAAGGGLVVLVAALLFGNTIIKEFTPAQMQRGADSSRTTTEQKNPAPPASQVVQPNVPTKKLTPMKPVEPDVPNMNQPKSIPVMDREPAVKPATQPTRTTKTVSQNIVKQPSVQSKLVIYNDNGKVASRIEQTPAQNKGAYPTRPRIVRNPRP
jgi:serine/threonine protein kinase